MKPSRILPSVVLAFVLVLACGGDDGDDPPSGAADAGSDDGSGGTGPGTGGGGDHGDGDGDGDGGDSTDIPDVDACSLGADTIRALFAAHDPTVTPTPQPTTGTQGGPACDWATSSTTTPLNVTVSSYGDWLPYEPGEVTTIPDLGDEAVDTGSSVIWRRDGFSVYLRPGDIDVGPEDLVALAREIDTQMPS